MNTTKRPKALLTVAQAICVLAIALTLLPALLPTYMLVSLLEKADQKREELSRQAVVPAAGSGFSIISESGEDDPAVNEKIEARRAAKKAKDFALADRIRDELKAQGIELTDIPGGVRWKRI